MWARTRFRPLFHACLEHPFLAGLLRILRSQSLSPQTDTTVIAPVSGKYR